MEDRFLQQLKKGVLEMLVLASLCQRESYGYELLTRLKAQSGGLFALKEGTLYPILYRLEDDGLIESSWLSPAGRAAPKKIYSATTPGRQEAARRRALWLEFVPAVEAFFEGGTSNEEAT